MLFEDLDLGSITFVDRPIERRFSFGGLRVRIGAVFEEQFQRVCSFVFRRNSTEQWRFSILGWRQARIYLCTRVDPAANESNGLPDSCSNQQLWHWFRDCRHKVVGSR